MCKERISFFAPARRIRIIGPKLGRAISGRGAIDEILCTDKINCHATKRPNGNRDHGQQGETGQSKYNGTVSRIVHAASGQHGGKVAPPFSPNRQLFIRYERDTPVELPSAPDGRQKRNRASRKPVHAQCDGAVQNRDVDGQSQNAGGGEADQLAAQDVPAP